MQIASFPFSIVDWNDIEKMQFSGITGQSSWKTVEMNDIRIRLVEYSKNYLADHWCMKGHVIFCVEGAMTMELKSGKEYRLEKGMTYITGDNGIPHKSSSEQGCKLFIVD